MSADPAGRASAAATLREYLADRDVPCHQCGYNLRGTLDVYCPECGAVILRPPSEDVARAAMDPAELKLFCRECDYVVTGVNARRCPECGGEDLIRFINQRPPNRRRLFRPRGVPAPLWVIAVFGVIELPLTAGRVLLNPRDAGVAVPLAIVSAGMSLIPAAIAALWYWQRPAIRRWDPGRRFAASGFGFLFGLLALLAAFVALQ